MALEPLVFLGASTSFLEIAPIIADLNTAGSAYEIVAILDDDTALHGKRFGNAVVAGPLAAIADYPDARVIFGIGSHRTRLQRLRILRNVGLPEDRYLTVVHPAARIYPDATVGAGAIIHAGVVVASEARVDPFAVITFNAIIGNRTVVGWGALIASAAVVLSDAVIGPCAFVGASVTIAEKVQVGAGAMVGMGSVLTRNVADGAFVLGNPPRTLMRSPVPADLTAGVPITLQEME
jgi:sugar O-acyltransferase (sialic acid O-acetyltransferase NeuD family)